MAVWFIYTWYTSPTMKRVIAKGLASLCFVILGIICCQKADASATYPNYTTFMVTALVLGMVGDVLLGLRENYMEKGKPLFIGGLGAFLVGHIFFILLFTHIQPIGIPAAAISIAFLVFLLLAKKPAGVELGNLAGPVYVYAVIISLMVGTGFGALIADPKPLTIVLAVGAALFAVSDCLLSVFLFGRSKPNWLRAANLGFYYTAQNIMALSALFIAM